MPPTIAVTRLISMLLRNAVDDARVDRSRVVLRGSARPSGSWKLPMARNPGARPGTGALKRKNGSRPEPGPAPACDAGRAGGAPRSAMTVAAWLTIGRMRVGAGYLTSAPTTASHPLVISVLGRGGLRRGRVDGARDVRQLGDQVASSTPRAFRSVEAGRVAVALQPAGLALVGVQVLHPQLGGVRMRRVGADRLDVDAREPAGRRDGDVDLRVAGGDVLVGERVVGPADGDRRLAGVDRAPAWRSSGRSCRRR